MKKILLLSGCLVTFLFSGENTNYMDGMKYRNENNIPMAENKFLSSCQQNNMGEGCFEAGMMLANKDKLKSFELLKKSCDLNYKQACVKLANLYLIGRQNGGVVDKNEDLAEKYYQKGIK